MGKTTSRAAGYLMAISGGVLWAVAGACGQELYRVNTITTGWLIPIRLLCAGAIFLLLARLQGHPILPIWRGQKNMLQLLLYGCFGVSASQYTFYACIEYANVAFSTVLCYICPIFILLFSLIKGRRAPKLYEVSAVVLVVVGVFACATHFDVTKLIVSPIALAMGLLCGLTAAINTLLPLRLMEQFSLFTVIGWGMLIGGTVVALLFRPWTIPVRVDGQLIGFMAVIVLCGTVLAFSCYMRGVQVAGPVSGCVLSSVEPVAAVIISILFLNVRFTAADFAGFVMILLTVPIIAIGQQRELAQSGPEAGE